MSVEFKTFQAGHDELMVSRHPNGMVFLYAWEEKRGTEDRTMTLVVLDQDLAVEVANAMLGPITVQAEPDYMADAPPVLDDDQIDALMDEPEYDDFAGETQEQTYERAHNEWETLGFERGYTAGYGDRVMEELGVDPDGYNDSDSYESTARIIRLESDLYERGQINGTTFDSPAEQLGQ